MESYRFQQVIIKPRAKQEDSILGIESVYNEEAYLEGKATEEIDPLLGIPDESHQHNPQSLSQPIERSGPWRCGPPASDSSPNSSRQSQSGQNIIFVLPAPKQILPKPTLKPVIWRCGQCQEQFSDKNSVAEHYRSAHAPAPARYKALIRSLVKPSTSHDQNRHAGSANSTRIETNPQRGEFITKVKKEIREVGIGNVHSKIKCKACGEGFKDKDECDQHFQSHKNKLTNKWICISCDREFHGLFFLQRHVKCHQDPPKLYKSVNTAYKSKPPVKCHEDPPKLIKSANAAYKSKPQSLYNCPHCEERFRSVPDLDDHISSVHDDDDENEPIPIKPYKEPLRRGIKKYECIHCENRFMNIFMLHRHLSSCSGLGHNGRNSFKCTECPKSYTKMDYLRLHLRSHIATSATASTIYNSFKYKCSWPDCSEAFISTVARQKHLYDFHGFSDDMLTFKCEDCNKGFIQQRDLTRHMRIHLNSTNSENNETEEALDNDNDGNDLERFQCGICEKSYLEEFLLKMHMRIHQPGIEHSCPHCQKKFKDIAIVNKHKKRSHPELD